MSLSPPTASPLTLAVGAALASVLLGVGIGLGLRLPVRLRLPRRLHDRRRRRDDRDGDGDLDHANDGGAAAAAAATIPTHHPHQHYEVFVATDRFKFTASHFIAFAGFRERLHGHNYSVSLRLVGGPGVGADGYVLDFGEVKRVVAGVCKELNEHFIMPERSDCLEVERVSTSASTNTSEALTTPREAWRITCEDESQFVFPCEDVAVLPIVHSSAEEIAAYVWDRVVSAFTVERLRERGIREVEVSVAEAPNQQASFRRALDSTAPRSFAAPQPCSASPHDADQ